MTSCTFMHCKNHSRSKNKKTHGITFHTFPLDEIWKSKWIDIMRKQRNDPDWTPTIYNRICSIHFKPEHLYTTSKGIKRISQGAIPNFQEGVEADNHDTFMRPGTPNSLEDVDVSDIDSILESPRESYLKRKLDNALRDKKRLMQDNKNLKKQNKRLLKKCNDLKEALLILKKEAGKEHVEPCSA